MGAIAVHHTDTTEGTWDGPGAVADMPNEAATLRYCHAWVNSGGDPDAKGSYKFPHHRTEGGPAVMAGVRNALARLSQADIPEGDRAGVERHLRAHMDDSGAEEEEESERETPSQPPPAELGEEQRQGDYEVRSYPLVEVRAEGEGESKKIVGIAAVYNQPTRIDTPYGGFVEVIEPGFFEHVMRDDVRALWNHNTDLVLGRTKSGTLSLEDRAEGLGTVIHPPDTQWGRDAVTSIQRGDVDQMSFAFSVKSGMDEWKENPDGVKVRRLKRGACKNLYDVSPVSFPAYPQTSVGVRSRLQSQQNVEGTRVGEAEQGLQPEAQAAQGRRLARLKRKIRLLLMEEK